MTSFEQALAAVDRPQTSAHLRSSSFWRRELPVMDNGRVIKGGMWEPQAQWWDLPNFVKLFVGGYGAGKSNLVPGKRAISSALTNAPVPVAVVSPSYVMAKKTIIPEITSLLEGKRSIFGREFWWSFNQSSPPTFRIRYHGRQASILVLSGEKPNSLRGANLAAAFIDEPFIQDVEVFLQMNARVRHPDAVHMEIGMSGTPEQLNWGYDLATGGEDFENVDVGIVHADTRSNLALGPEYVRRLESAYDERAAQAFVGGQFVNLSKGQVYYSFNPLENVVHIQIPAGAELGVGMDFNVNPMAFCAFWIQGVHMHVFAEWELPNSDTEYACQLLRETFGERLIDIYPDPAGNQRHTNSPGGKTDFHYITSAGFRVNARPQHPAIKDRYNAVNGKLKARDGTVSLTISPECKKLRKYLSVYTHEGINTAASKKMSHLLDALGYPLEYRFPAKKELLTLRRITGY